MVGKVDKSQRVERIGIDSPRHFVSGTESIEPWGRTHRSCVRISDFTESLTRERGQGGCEEKGDSQLGVRINETGDLEFRVKTKTKLCRLEVRLSSWTRSRRWRSGSREIEVRDRVSYFFHPGCYRGRTGFTKELRPKLGMRKG